MKSCLKFRDLARLMTDAWVSNAGKVAAADAILRSVEKLVRINMVLATIDMRTKTPQDWGITFVRTYGIPTTLFDSRQLQRTRNLSGFSGRTYVERHVVDVCKKSVEIGRPSFAKIDEKIHDVRIVANQLIVPDTSREGHWCVVLSEIHSISSVGQPTRFDDIDLSVLQLLREGLSAREIGAAIELSPRTVEHRIEKMKARTGVNAIIRLLSTID